MRLKLIYHGVYMRHTAQHIQHHKSGLLNRQHVLTSQIFIDKVRPMFHEKAKHGCAPRSSLQPQQHGSILWFCLHIETDISAK